MLEFELIDAKVNGATRRIDDEVLFIILNVVLYKAKEIFIMVHTLHLNTLPVE